MNNDGNKVSGESRSKPATSKFASQTNFLLHQIERHLTSRTDPRRGVTGYGTDRKTSCRRFISNRVSSQLTASDAPRPHQTHFAGSGTVPYQRTNARIRFHTTQQTFYRSSSGSRSLSSAPGLSPSLLTLLRFFHL